MSSQSKDFNVAIVGGGMCGLVCAVALMRAGISVRVFEQAAKFEEIGAGVGLGPNALFALEQLGVLQAILAKAEESKPMRRPFLFVSGMDMHEQVYDYPFTKDDLGLAIYRPVFLEALMPMLDSSCLYFNHRCVSVTTNKSGSHSLHFEGGKTYEADLVIGADGIRSVIRDFVADVPTAPAFSNTVAYRAIIPTEALEKAGVKTDLKVRPICWVGQDRHIITFPIQTGKTINIVAFSTNSKVPIGSVKLPTPWVKSATENELLSDYSGWGSDVITMLQQIRNPSKWSIHFLYPPLPSYLRGRVVLVGDSAHAMMPHLGAGVGQGFEDSFVLCKLLTDPRARAHNLDNILQAYDKVRVPRANMVHKQSSDAGDIYEGRGKFGNTASERRKQLEGIWQPVWHYSLSLDIERAAAEAFGMSGRLTSTKISSRL